jgi:O-antigen ligase
VKHWTNLVVLIVFVGSLFFLLRKKEVSVQDTDELTLRWRWIRGEYRITTYFVDPLSFGSLTLLFLLLSVAALSFFWLKLSITHRIFMLIAIFSGLYLSVMSGSRTGWLVIPFFLFIWIRFFTWQQYGKVKVILLVLLLLGGIYLFIPLQPLFVEKIFLAQSEISNYRWNSLNPDNSVSMRISFQRMAVFYFLENPLKGWGDLGWMRLIYGFDRRFKALLNLGRCFAGFVIRRASRHFKPTAQLADRYFDAF